jgi:hypothetical protein
MEAAERPRTAQQIVVALHARISEMRRKQLFWREIAAELAKEGMRVHPMSLLAAFKRYEAAEINSGRMVAAERPRSAPEIVAALHAGISKMRLERHSWRAISAELAEVGGIHIAPLTLRMAFERHAAAASAGKPVGGDGHE